uniref:Fibroblast growth factor n=3 Tax=Gasterosteus aculeatus TaxID=69293 RepID=A0AAQ4QQW9_GASAC
MLAHREDCHVTISQVGASDPHICILTRSPLGRHSHQRHSPKVPVDTNQPLISRKKTLLVFRCCAEEKPSGSGEASHTSCGFPLAPGPRGMSEGDVTVLPLGPASWQEHRTLTRLYCQNGGHHLRILPDGAVSGGRQENDPHDILRLQAVSVGVVVIKGEGTGRYLAMSKRGCLYGSPTLNDECYFLEKYEENHHNTYCSQKYAWYVGLKRNGQPKPGPDTHRGQKAVFFLPRPPGNM